MNFKIPIIINNGITTAQNATVATHVGQHNIPISTFIIGAVIIVVVVVGIALYTRYR